MENLETQTNECIWREIAQNEIALANIYLAKGTMTPEEYASRVRQYENCLEGNCEGCETDPRKSKTRLVLEGVGK